MERLYAPWRMNYVSADVPVRSSDSSDHKCIFCVKAASSDDAANLVVYRGTHVFVLMNIYPYNNGHLMIVPYAHTSEISDLSVDNLTEMMVLVKASRAALGQAYRPQGYNIGMNIGQIAGAGIADHLHLHIVPRWVGDTNFMPVLGDVKVLPDSLQSSYEKIFAAWAATFQC